MTIRVFLAFLIALSSSAVSHPQGNTKQALTPDKYDLAGGNLHVNYSSTSKNGQPFLSYQDGSKTLSFKGNEIRQVNSALGTLVTVTIQMTVDSGSTTFTLLVPSVRLAEMSPVQIHTIGITTVHRFSVVPAANRGQTELYTTTELSGTAEMVLF